MRVLIAHNAYQQRGGEDSVVDDEVALLRSRGAEVDLMQLHNDDIADMGRAELLSRTLWSRPAAREMTILRARSAKTPSRAAPATILWTAVPTTTFSLVMRAAIR